MQTIKALVFEVFGTLVDWRGGVVREVRRLLGDGVDAPTRAELNLAWRRLDAAAASTRHRAKC